MSQTKEQRRQNRAYKLIRAIAGPVVKRIFNYKAELASLPDGAFLVLANHNTDLDPALVALSFPNYLRFVGSEHIFRSMSKLLSVPLMYFFAPISRSKGHSAYDTIRNIQRTLAGGTSVCMFAEGNRSFSGLSGYISPATANLVKSVKVPLITYKMEGGYFTSPRWSFTLRRGAMRGYCVNVYTAEQLKHMSNMEIYEALCSDLFEDAYARQESFDEPVRFKGKRLAEGLELALYTCPICKHIGTLTTLDSTISCTCGFSLYYDETGYFRGSETPFSTIKDWDEWQLSYMSSIADNKRNSIVFSDDNISLIKIDEDKHTDTEIDFGTLKMYYDRLKIGKTVITLDSISKMSQHGRSTIVFTADGTYYELRKNGGEFCARKYVTYCSIRTGGKIQHI